jgi:hypothetical protein
LAGLQKIQGYDVIHEGHLGKRVHLEWGEARMD